MSALGTWYWVACYEMEQRRQVAAGCGHLWRESVYCVVLAVLRLIRWPS